MQNPPQRQEKYRRFDDCFQQIIDGGTPAPAPPSWRLAKPDSPNRNGDTLTWVCAMLQPRENS